MVIQCGDRVLYGVHGVCKVLETQERKIDRRRIEYYVLEPLEQPGTRYLVPTQNAAAVSKLREIISPQALNELLHSPDIYRDAWIPDKNQRMLAYRDLMENCDRAELVRMICTLHRHKREQELLGRKFHICDENFLRDAEKMLGSEFSMVLNIHRSEIGKYIRNMLKTE